MLKYQVVGDALSVRHMQMTAQSQRWLEQLKQTFGCNGIWKFLAWIRKLVRHKHGYSSLGRIWIGWIATPAVSFNPFCASFQQHILSFFFLICCAKIMNAQSGSRGTAVPLQIPTTPPARNQDHVMCARALPAAASLAGRPPAVVASRLAALGPCLVHLEPKSF